MEITPESKAAYLKDDHHCPFCGSKNIEGAGEDFLADGKYYLKNDCLKCKHSWDDVYIFMDVEDNYTHPHGESK